MRGPRDCLSRRPLLLPETYKSTAVLPLLRLNLSSSRHSRAGHDIIDARISAGVSFTGKSLRYWCAHTPEKNRVSAETRKRRDPAVFPTSQEVNRSANTTSI